MYMYYKLLSHLFLLGVFITADRILKMKVIRIFHFIDNIIANKYLSYIRNFLLTSLVVHYFASSNFMHRHH